MRIRTTMSLTTLRLEMSLTPNKIISGKLMVTPDTFIRSRIKVADRPSYSDPQNGDSYPVLYSYITADGSNKEEYLRFVPCTLSLIYGCAKRQAKEGEVQKEDAKHGITMGFRVSQTDYVRDPRNLEDDRGKLLGWEDLPRHFKVMDGPTGNAWRGDDKQITPQHAQLICDYYHMIAEAQSEIRTQLASIYPKNKNGKRLGYSSSKDLLRGPEGSDYVDIRATVAQFQDKNNPKEVKIAMRVTTDPEGKNTLTFQEFCDASGGARVVPWCTIPSVHVSVDGHPRVRLTVDRLLVKELGHHPNSSRENLAVNLDELANDGEEFKVSPKKRVLSEMSGELNDRDSTKKTFFVDDDNQHQDVGAFD
jgi:hypothetical protein